MSIFDPISIPLGKLMSFIYYTITFQNYGFALIVFTILTRLLMLPLTIKQYKGTAKMQKLNPRLEELRRQYGTDKKKLNEETIKLYQEEKVNPAGGCLPLLIQMPILFSLYPVITRPLRYILEKSQEQINLLTDLYREFTGAAGAFIQEMEILNYFKTNPASMMRAEAAGLLKPTELLNVRFLGLDLSRTPTYAPEVLFGDQMSVYLPLLLIPIIGVLSTYISGRFTMASTAAQSAQNQQASSMSKSMQFIGPVMTLIFSFQLPAGVLIYWIAGYLIQIVQQLFINKYVLKLDNIFTGAGGSSAADGAGNAAARIAGGASPAALITGGPPSATSSNVKSSLAAPSPSGAGTPAQGNASSAGAGASVKGAGNFINKVTNFGRGGAPINAKQQGGLVHGGVFKPAVYIPGVTPPPSEDADDAPEPENGAGPDGESGAGLGNAAGAGGVGSAGGADGSISDVQSTDQQRARGVDHRSNTKKNYGTHKRKKKK